MAYSPLTTSKDPMLPSATPEVEQEVNIFQQQLEPLGEPLWNELGLFPSRSTEGDEVLTAQILAHLGNGGPTGYNYLYNSTTRVHEWQQGKAVPLQLVMKYEPGDRLELRVKHAHPQYEANPIQACRDKTHQGPNKSWPFEVVGLDPKKSKAHYQELTDDHQVVELRGLNDLDKISIVSYCNGTEHGPKQDQRKWILEARAFIANKGNFVQRLAFQCKKTLREPKGNKRIKQENDEERMGRKRIKQENDEPTEEKEDLRQRLVSLKTREIEEESKEMSKEVLKYEIRKMERKNIAMSLLSG